ncbi:DUF7331 family protein [Natranaeroarchaeum aerophilus]|uniref:Uncharacterized protein n=1 Tax=Natranaeroarchaeum aerophilus TaxID=2917711 RepID=A0AAE3FU06_9EURY|nr:hypothetical protein [Natranaeroarchaeum aerophilus]MCL9815100.1 hypothetical protein [Natranaeroarchaeum aerophilus]
MTNVSDHATTDWQDSATERADGVETVERYETDEGVVFFDADNPLAWVEATRTVELDNQV